jgi:hypothetical protein
LTRRPRRTVAFLCLVVGAATGAGLLAAGASAGPYRAMLCARNMGVGSPAFQFSRSGSEFRPVTGCQSGEGLGVTHKHGATRPGRFGMWTARAPAGVRLTDGSVVARGRAEAGYHPGLLLGAADGDTRAFASPRGGFRLYNWHSDDGASRLIAQLVCARSRGSCGRSDAPKIFIKHAMFHLFDSSRPTLSQTSGTLLEGSAQRGTQGFAVAAHDVGSGVRRVFLRVNGRAFDSIALDCAIDSRRDLALRLDPCPQRGTAPFSVDTHLAPFREGPNRVAACVLDYAGSSPNERCSRKTVRVDNDCPVSGGGVPARTNFSFADGARRARVKFGRRPVVVGKLSRISGQPLVCISQRVSRRHTTEHLVGVPRRVDSHGNVHAQLPAGPSRTVYLTYWSGAEQVVTRKLELRVKPPVGLLLRPTGTLHNGQKMRLRAKLRGAYHGHRKVRFLARPPGGDWTPFSTHFTKRTNGRGVAVAKHTFHNVVGSQSFQFKVLVPRQRGYPYLRGQSQVRQTTVVGG